MFCLRALTTCFLPLPCELQSRLEGMSVSIRSASLLRNSDTAVHCGEAEAAAALSNSVLFSLYLFCQKRGSRATTLFKMKGFASKLSSHPTAFKSV